MAILKIFTRVEFSLLNVAYMAVLLLITKDES